MEVIQLFSELPFSKTSSSVTCKNYTQRDALCVNCLLYKNSQNETIHKHELQMSFDIAHHSFWLLV